VTSEEIRRSGDPARRQTPDRPSVGIATCAAARGVDEDAPLLRSALERLGVVISEVDWDDPGADWGAHDLVVIRSTWDYMPRRDEFVKWAHRVESVTRLANPAEVLAWNTDKHYLAELAGAGVPIVATSFVEPDGPGGDPVDLAEILRSMSEAASGGFVVKPAISAGSKDTARYASPSEDPTAVDSGSEHMDALRRAGRSVMVQPYMSRVDTDGETGLVFFDGRFSHAFRKGPLLEVGAGPVTGLFAPEVIDPRTPSRSELDLADSVMETIRERSGRDLLYARVDLVPDDAGNPVLQELELTEPSFFLTTEPDAADRIASAIRTAIERADDPKLN